jgi:peptide/nickel transport system ATP-binding protein
VQDRCLEEEPPLIDAADGHQYRCWFPVGTPEGAEALERNRKAGTDATLLLEGETV